MLILLRGDKLTKTKRAVGKANCSNQGCNSRCKYSINGILSFTQEEEGTFTKLILPPKGAS